jgi:hypothetical protein
LCCECFAGIIIPLIGCFTGFVGLNRCSRPSELVSDDGHTQELGVEPVCAKMKAKFDEISTEISVLGFHCR